MQLYSANIRLGGLMLTDVPKINVTAGEVILLRSIHGADGVINIKHIGQAERSSNAERERLVALYGEEKFVGVFGGAYVVQLPDKLDEIASSTKEPVEEEEEEEEEEVVADAAAPQKKPMFNVKPVVRQQPKAG